MSVRCQKFIRLARDGERVIRYEYIDDMRDKTGEPDAVMGIDGSEYRLDKGFWLILYYGDKDNKYQHCNVLGYSDYKTGYVFIYESQEKIAKECLRGLKPGRSEETAGPTTKMYSPVDDQYNVGLNPSYILFIKDPVGKEKEIVDKINNATTEKEKANICGLSFLFDSWKEDVPKYI